VLSVRFEPHLHVKSNKPWRTIDMFVARQEYHLHIKSKVIPITGCGGPKVFPVRYEQQSTYNKGMLSS
jgi:hypothetical protein